MSEPAPEPREDVEPQLVVDDSWKERVAREKAAQRRQAREAAPNPHLPAASFPMLVSTLAAQAMASLGFLPTPQGEPTQVDKPLAKHFIDLLGMLEEKTRGNLDSEEQTLLKETLHQLRMAFVQSAAAPPAAPPKSTLELP